MYEFIQGRVCTSEDLSREPVCRGVARKLGEWHSVLPIASANKTKGTHHTNGVPALDASCPEVTSRYQRIKSTTPGKVAPNLWTVLQKWILALPRETEAQMKRNDLLQVELERIVTEFGNLPGLGKDGVCSDSTHSSHQALLIALAIADLRALRSSFRERYPSSTSVRPIVRDCRCLFHRLRVCHTCSCSFRHCKPFRRMGRLRMRLQRAAHALPT